jgi:hypothetical protein
MSRFKVTTDMRLNNDAKDSSVLSLFNRNSPDRNLFNLVDSEIIKLGGSEILVYRYIPSDDVDEVYMESKQKTIETEGIKVYGNYDPRPIEESLTQFGVEVQNDQVFVFNKSYIERIIGRSIIPGDILQPLFQNMKFEVFQVQEDSFESYGIYHLLVHAKFLRDTQEIHNEPFFDRTNDVGGVL